MELAYAQWLADEVMQRLAPACERIEVAGSVRRREPEVKDVEIVYISKMAPVPGQLMDVHSYPLTEDVITEEVRKGFWRFDDDVRRNGPKYKRLIHCDSGLVVELFRAEVENWGVILALRTGPADFNKMLVAHGWEGGILPPWYELKDGRLMRRGVPFPTHEETDFFGEIGLPTWPPDQRHPGRLRLWEKSQSRVARFE